MLVWTEKAEEIAKALGLEERKAGAEATYGYEKLEKFGQVRLAWLEKGYVEYRGAMK